MIQIPKLHTTDEHGQFVSFGQNEFAKFSQNSDEIVFRALNEDYTVTLNGKPCEVRECRVSALPFNRPWPGKQRPFSQTESAGFFSFASDEEVTVRVTPKKPFTHAILRPLACGIIPVEENGTLVFCLRTSGSYVLELDDSHRALHIFFNEIKEIPKKEDVTYYFGAGIHFPGTLCLRDHDSVFIHPEAIVFATIEATDAKNIRIFGSGVLDGSMAERITEHCYENHTKGNLRFYHCNNLRIEDVILTNSATWCLALFQCKNAVIDGVKIVGQWRYNTDGIDLVNSDHIVIRNCFIRSFDDAITIKGIYDYPFPIEEILVEHCVLWCGWGHTCELGIETDAALYQNITFTHCELIHTSDPALAIANGNCATIRDICFSHINVEFQKEQLPQIVQTSDAQIYDAQGTRGLPLLFSIRNIPFAIRKKSGDRVVRAKTHRPYSLSNVRLEDIHVYTDDDTIRPIILIENDHNCFSDITLCDLYLNEVRQTNFDAFQLELKDYDLSCEIS